MKHQFSEPWEDSDLILKIENEKFHVHRLILRMNSPVFKAMFKPQFKEASSSEIELPKKKANEVLDFLKQIYFPYIMEKVEITSKFIWFIRFCLSLIENLYIYCIRRRKNTLLIRIGVEIVRDNVDYLNEWMDLGMCVWHPSQIFLQGWMTSQRREILRSRSSNTLPNL